MIRNNINEYTNENDFEVIEFKVDTVFVESEIFYRLTLIAYPFNSCFPDCKEYYFFDELEANHAGIVWTLSVSIDLNFKEFATISRSFKGKYREFITF